MASPPSTATLRVVDHPASPRRRLFWQLQIGSWVLLMPFFVGFAITVFHDWNVALLIGGVRQGIGFLLTLGLWRIYRRWPPASFKLARQAWLIALLCVAATTIDMLLAEVGRHWLKVEQLPDLAQYGSLIIRLALYLAWSAFYFVIRQELEIRETALRLARAEAANRESELQLLRAQMNPHFIFNALNTIIGEAENNPAAVMETTHAIADYLRYTLRQNSHQAALGDELDAMSNYLRVERISYGAKRLEWKIEASPEARAAFAPTALVQPLIENAIKYGMRGTAPVPLQVRIHAQVADNRLEVVVENSGEWVAKKSIAAAQNSHGIGLTNLQRRLNLLCGPTSRFDVTTPPGFVRIQITMPHHSAPLTLSAESPERTLQTA